MTLREVPVHTTVKVVKINGEGAFRRRIMGHGHYQKQRDPTFVK